LLKIRCTCGFVIRDNTGNLPYKAYILPDQDIDVACVGEEPSPAQLRLWDHTAGQLTMLWQCEVCGRIYFDGPSGKVFGFKPESTPTPTNLLRSVWGEGWAGLVRGDWETRSDGVGHGELTWTEDAGEGHFEEFEDVDRLKQRYHEVFADLHRRSLVRDALLLIDGATVHTWPGADQLQ
jgi:hypothetical protein